MRFSRWQSIDYIMYHKLTEFSVHDDWRRKLIRRKVIYASFKTAQLIDRITAIHMIVAIMKLIKTQAEPMSFARPESG